MKRCARCSETKHEAEFRQDKKAKDGLFSWCRACCRTYDRQRTEKRYKSRRIGRPPKQIVNGEFECGTCGSIKPVADFGTDSSTPAGLRPRCKDCDSRAAKRYHERNRERRIANTRAWQKANPERCRQLRAESNKRCQPRIRAYYREWLSNPRNRLSNQLRVRLAGAIRGQIERQKKPSARRRKSGSAVRDLGCTMEELMLHLERQFKQGMSWDNYGRWHVDHIKPLASFDLLDRVELLQAVHFTNLQPLWASENFVKNARTTDESEE
jgi:hypothetical protein